jgi:DNA-binding NarL/FixJ family response regulator
MRVLIAEDDPILRAGLRASLETSRDIESLSASERLAKVPIAHRRDLATSSTDGDEAVTKP